MDKPHGDKTSPKELYTIENLIEKHKNSKSAIPCTISFPPQTRDPKNNTKNTTQTAKKTKGVQKQRQPPPPSLPKTNQPPPYLVRLQCRHERGIENHGVTRRPDDHHRADFAAVVFRHRSVGQHRRGIVDCVCVCGIVSRVNSGGRCKSENNQGVRKKKQ
jgi:hypothetical protein